jgi:hypothetical protein
MGIVWAKVLLYEVVEPMWVDGGAMLVIGLDLSRRVLRHRKMSQAMKKPITRRVAIAPPMMPTMLVLLDDLADVEIGAAEGDDVDDEPGGKTELCCEAVRG